MTNYHEIPAMVSAAVDSDSDFGLRDDAALEVADPVDALRDAESELETVFETLNELSAVGEECIAFDTDQLSAARLLDLCRSIETIRDTLQKDPVQVHAVASLYETVLRSVQLAECQVTLYANLLDIPTTTSPYLYPSDFTDRHSGGRVRDVPKGRVIRVIDVAARSLDELEDFQASTRSIPEYIDVDAIRADCTVLAELEVISETADGNVEVVAESHHFGIRDAAVVSNQWLHDFHSALDCRDDRTHCGTYDQDASPRESLLIERFERTRTKFQMLPDPLSCILATIWGRY